MEEETRLIDGSEYRGTWDVLGMEGIGKFILPHNTVFEGEFRDGTFHGHGSTYWPRGQRMDGVWTRGKSTDQRYVFHDGLIFRRNAWNYCLFPDRRYLTSVKHGLKPAGATLRTDNPNRLLIPPKCYDSGIGIFNPRTYCITSYRDPNNILEIPNTELANWIEKNCRKAWSEPTGNRQDLYENWFSRQSRVDALSTLLPFSDRSPESWWKRLTVFRRDRIWKEEEPKTCRLCPDKSLNVRSSRTDHSNLPNNA